MSETGGEEEMGSGAAKNPTWRTFGSLTVRGGRRPGSIEKFGGFDKGNKEKDGG